MLKKLIAIKNVGFKNYGAIGDVELKRHSLLFAENGRGKTTLCAILRSLQSGVPAHIIGRTTLSSADPPEVRILSDGATLIFTAGAWSAAIPEIAIFDATFVSENVFSGDLVGFGHKRSLYRLIVGKDGVTLAREIEQLDEASRAKAAEIREKTAPLQALLPRGTTLESLLAIEEDPGVDEKIRAAEGELQAVREAEQIRARALLTVLDVPVMPAGFTELLARTVDGIAHDAEAQVNAQVEAHAMRERGQVWLSEGVGYVRDDPCPFCSQNLAPAARLIAAYRAFFSHGYRDLRTAIAAMRTSVENVLGDRQIAASERTLDQNNAGVEFWSRFCEIAAAPPPENAGEKLRALRNAAIDLLTSKAAAPLEPVVPGDAFMAGAVEAASLTVAASAYNEAIGAANAVIAARKAVTGATDVRTVEATLAALRLAKKRHEPEANAACVAYQAAVAEKARIEGQKATVKGKLDEPSAP